VYVNAVCLLTVKSCCLR